MVNAPVPTEREYRALLQRAGLLLTYGLEGWGVEEEQLAATLLDEITVVLATPEMDRFERGRILQLCQPKA